MGREPGGSQMHPASLQLVTLPLDQAGLARGREGGKNCTVSLLYRDSGKIPALK